MANEEIRLRAACDRCHNQKLRCPKVSSSGTCGRCAKAQVQCSFSPFRQKKEKKAGSESIKASMVSQLSSLEERISTFTANGYKPPESGSTKRKRGVTPVPTDTPLDPCHFPNARALGGLAGGGSSGLGVDDTVPILSNVDFDFTPFGDFNFGTAFNQPDLRTFSPMVTEGYSSKDVFVPLDAPSFLDYSFEIAALHTQSKTISNSRRWSETYNPIISGFDSHEPNNAVDFVDVWSERQLIQNLSNLSIGLYDHMKSIPSQSIHDKEDPTEEPEIGNYQSYSIGETFKCTQQLVDMYPPFIDTFLAPEASRSWKGNHEDSRLEDMLTNNSRNDSLERVSTHAGHRSLDHSSILLILSCHTRLLDVFDKLFQHVCVCSQHIKKATTVQEAWIMPPPIKMGTYTLPAASSVPFQVLLLIQMATQLSANAAQLKACLQTSSSDWDRQKEISALSLATAEGVVDRADRMSRKLTTLKGRLMGEKEAGAELQWFCSGCNSDPCDCSRIFGA